MKYILCCIICLPFLVAQDDGSYDLIIKYKKGDVFKYKTDFIMAMSVPGMGNFEIGRVFTLENKYLGEEDGLIIVEQIMTKMIATNKVWDKMSTDYKMNQMVGVSFKIYIKPDGTIDHTSSEHRHLEETISSLTQDVGQINYLYPFGIEAIDVSVGDTWNVKNDSVVFYAGEGDIESLMFIDSDYSFDKIKIKKGREIAYISEISKLRCKMNIVQGGTFMEGEMYGDFKGSYRFDLDNGKVLLKKSSGNMEYTFLMEDKYFKTVMSISEKTKKVK